MATMVGQKTGLEMMLWKHFVLVLLNNDTKIRCEHFQFRKIKKKMVKHVPLVLNGSCSLSSTGQGNADDFTSSKTCGT